MIKSYLKLLIPFIFLSSSLALAEYRVYQYLIKSNNLSPDLNATEATTELSTMDPQAYLQYHGGYGALEISLQRTWHCPGYTGKKKNYCSPPSMENKK